MNRRPAIAVVTVVVLVAAAGGFARFRGATPLDGHHDSRDPSTWTEVAWPFPLDQWGSGKAFKCKPADCGSEANVYLRAKLGFCNCATGVANDEDLDRMSDFDLVGGEVSPLAPGLPVRIGGMNGRHRAYALTASTPPGKSAISVVFNDRCDMVVATVVLPHDRPTTIEPAVIDFLNSATVLHWARVTSVYEPPPDLGRPSTGGSLSGIIAPQTEMRPCPGCPAWPLTGAAASHQ